MAALRKPQVKHYIEPDVLLVHKPVGISSFGLLKKMRHILGIKKIGHAGTLDPLAHGLMIVGIGSGTKKMSHYLKLPKVYLADILVGKSTSTGDAEGEIIERKEINPYNFPRKHIEDILRSFEGKHTFSVPLYSAVKVHGKPLYRYAREGKEPPFIPEKEMYIESLKLLDHYVSGDYFIIKVRADVGSGTYIRSLAEEIGKKCGYPASLQSLYRMRIGDYLDQDAFRPFPQKQYSFGCVRDILKVLFGKYFE